MGSEQSVAAAASELSERLGDDKLYAIVNNAGTGVSHNTKPNEIMDTNTRGPRRVVDSFLPLLQTNGRIVNVGSGGGPGHVNRIQAEDDNWERFLHPMNKDEIEKEINIIEAH